MSEYLIIQIMIRVSDRIVREIVDFYFYGYISKLPHAKKYLTKKLIKKSFIIERSNLIYENG